MELPSPTLEDRIDEACKRFEAAWRANTPPRIEDYLDGWHGPERGKLLRELVLLDYFHRRSAGQPAALTDYHERFPELAHDEATTAFRLDNTSAPTTAGTTGAASLPGGVLPPGYELLGELGRGGMGVVYKARHVRLDRVCALKMILSGGHAGRAERERFEIEAQAIARVQHPGIVQVFEIGEYADPGSGTVYPFMALEYCAGGSLEKRLSEQPPTARQAAEMVRTLAQAMQAAHAAHVIHRDLKPANVLLAADGTVKVTDFGLAKKLDEADRTQAGEVMGTPAFMAPEQASGTGQPGASVDIYALGAILYAALTGRPPFRGASALETIQQVLYNEVVPVRHLNPGTPRDLQTICHKCLQKDPARRYASAQELADDLDRFLDNRPIQARPVGRLERLARWCRRKPMAATAALLGGLLLCGAIVVPVLLAISQGRSAAALAGEKTKTLAALHTAQEAELRALRQAAESTLERAVQLCEQGEVSRGLLWLGRGLRLARQAQADDLEEALRYNLASWASEVHSLALMLPHPDAVNAAVYSPDGATIATGCKDGKVRLWQADTGSLLAELFVHASPAVALAYHPNGRLLAAGYRDGTVQFWEAGQPTPVRTLRYQATAVPDWMYPRLAFSPDGATLLTGGMGGAANLWEVATGQRRGRPLRYGEINGYVEGVAFTPDGRRALTAGMSTHLWDASTGDPLGSHPQGHGRATCVTSSPDGKTLVTSDIWNNTQARDMLTGRALGAKLLHRACVWSVAYSPDGSQLVTASQDHLARIWDGVTKQPIGAPLQHNGEVRSAVFRCDGRAVLTASDDGAARVWRVAAGNLVRALPLGGTGAFSLDFNQDGTQVLVTLNGQGLMRVWDCTTGQPVGPAIASAGEAIFSRDDQSLYYGWTTIARRSARDGQLQAESVPHGDEIWRLVLSPDGTTLASGSFDYKAAPQGRSARLWDARTLQPLGEPMAHDGKVFGIAFSPDGKAVLTGSHDRTTRLWNAATGQPLAEPVHHVSPVWSVAFSPDGKTALVGYANWSAQCWDLATGKATGPGVQHRGVVERVAFSRDGRLLVTASHDYTGRIWHAATGKPVGPNLKHTDKVIALAVSRDNRLVATGGNERTVRLWALPRPLDGDIEQVVSGVERATGLHLDPSGSPEVLAPTAWMERAAGPVALAAAPPLLQRPAPQPPAPVTESLIQVRGTPATRLATPAQIAAWVTELSGGQGTEAAAALAEIGPPARPALQACLKGADAPPEALVRAVLRKIDLSEATQPRRVTLRLDRVPLRRAVAAFAQASGLPLTLTGPGDRLVSLHLDHAPAWQALDELTRQARLAAVFGPEGVTLRPGFGPAGELLAYPGSFRLHIGGWSQIRPVPLSDALPSTSPDQVVLRLALGEPGTSSILAIGKPTATSALTDQGESLAALIAPGPVLEPALTAPGTRLRILGLRAPTRPAQKVTLQGILPVEVAVNHRPQLDLPLSEAVPGKWLPLTDGGWIRFQAPQLRAGNSTLTALVTLPGTLAVDPRGLDLELLDEAGRRTRGVVTVGTAGVASGVWPPDLLLLSPAGDAPWSGLAWLTSGRGRLRTVPLGVTFTTPTEPGVQSRLRVALLDRERVDLPFTFRDLTLP